jgi:ABC-type amino acid transport substrate-binding protein
MILLLTAAAARADWTAIKSTGALRVLWVQAHGQNEFFSNEPGRGFDREVLEGFASLHKIRLESVPLTSWDALIPDLNQGKGDVVAGRLTITETRRKVVSFTSEAFPTRAVVVSRKPHKAVTTLEEFRAEKVGTVKGTSLAEVIALAGVPKSNVVDTIPSGTLPQALKSGQVTAVVLGIENAITAQREDQELQLGLFLGPPGSLAYAVRKTDAELLKFLNEYIENLRRTPTWSRLVVKYFGEQAPDILRKARQQ